MNILVGEGPLIFNPLEVDFLRCTDFNYNDCVERCVALELYKVLQSMNYGLEADLVQTLGYNPNYDFKIKNTTFELKCSTKVELTIELSKGGKGADGMGSNPLLYPDLQRSALKQTKADYFVWISPGFSNTFRGEEVVNPITKKRGRNLFKVRIFPTEWIYEDIRSKREAILKEWSLRENKASLTQDQLRDPSITPFKLRYFPKSSLGPPCWAVSFNPLDYKGFRDSDGWSGYVGTKEYGSQKYLADLTDFAWEKERLKRALPKELFR